MEEKINTLCCIFNYAPHYRLSIFKRIDNEFGAHFYFGDKLLDSEHIAKINYKKLHGFIRELSVHKIKLGRVIIEYTRGWLKLALNRKYKQYIITPNVYALNQWLFLLLCFLLRKKVYSWTHGLNTKNVSSLTLKIWKCYDFFLSGSFLYGNYARNNMMQLGFNTQKLHVIYNSLDYESSLKLRQEHLVNPYESVFNNSYPTLVFIGRLTAVKKLHMIQQAVDILKDRGLFVNVAFIGDGPEKNTLQKLISPQDDKRFWFVGAIYDEQEIARYLYYADICISPGNVGLTCIHALSYGLPVITNDNFEQQMPEFEAIESGYTGVFFQENDIYDLANKIEIWVHNNNREDVRKRCYNVIDTKFNPNYQINLLKEILYKHN